VKKLVDRQVAGLNALCEIQDAFKRSGISEDELQKTGRRVRREIVRRRYTAKSEKTFGRVGEVKRNPPIKTK
jgi:hypothetical protein